MSTSVTFAEEAAYDRAPYVSHPFAVTQPSRAAAVAALFGLDAPDVRTARVLELGCAAGGNITPLAVRYPDAQFVGIDISARQIDDGNVRIEQLGLKNIQLRKQSITEFDEGPFDYIIAHGILSWVPKDVQDALVRLTARNLSPNGLAVISYNVLPGAYLRQPLRDIMLEKTEGVEDPVERVRLARDAVRRIAALSSPVGYGAAFRSEYENLPSRRDYYLLHEHLEGVNDAWYFRDVAARMASANLAYIAESDPWTSVPENYPSIAAVEMRALGGNTQASVEQSIDYFLGRRFRSSVFGHAKNLENRTFVIGDAALSRIYVALQAPISEYPEMPTGVARFESRRRRFILGDQSSYSARSEAVIRLLHLLEERRAESRGAWFVPDLVHAAAGTTTPDATVRRELFDCVAELFLGRMFYVFADSPPVAGITGKPCVFVTARVDAAHSRDESANLYHELVALTLPDMHYFLPLCDGSRTIDDLTREVAALMADGKITAEPAHEWVMQTLRKCVANKLLYAGDASQGKSA